MFPHASMSPITQARSDLRLLVMLTTRCANISAVSRPGSVKFLIARMSMVWCVRTHVWHSHLAVCSGVRLLDIGNIQAIKSSFNEFLKTTQNPAR